MAGVAPPRHDTGRACGSATLGSEALEWFEPSWRLLDPGIDPIHVTDRGHEPRQHEELVAAGSQLDLQPRPVEEQPLGP